jgi:hypothetical protein
VSESEMSEIYAYVSILTQKITGDKSKANNVLMAAVIPYPIKEDFVPSCDQHSAARCDI